MALSISARVSYSVIDFTDLLLLFENRKVYHQYKQQKGRRSIMLGQHFNNG